MLPELAYASVKEGHLLHGPCFYIKEGQMSDSEQRKLTKADYLEAIGSISQLWLQNSLRIKKVQLTKRVLCAQRVRQVVKLREFEPFRIVRNLL